ncbi:hypothetical protein LXL04_007747 [Taraxacum kok-saghyz]
MLVKKWNDTLVSIAKDHIHEISKVVLIMGEYEVCRSCDNQAEVKCMGKRWDVYLDKRKYSCIVWQVTSLPCVHAATFTSFIRNPNWDKYKFKESHEFEIAPFPEKDQWIHSNKEKIYPPIIKCPAGRPIKNRFKASDKSKRRHKCLRCGRLGYREKTCKNPASQSLDPSETSTSKRKKKCLP